MLIVFRSLTLSSFLATGQEGPPLQLDADKSSITVSWSLGKTNLITGFSLSYIPVLSAHYWHDIRTVSLKPSDRSYVIEQIDQSKMYRIELRIVSGPVISKPSIAVYTEEKRTAIPSDLQSLKVSNPRNLRCAVKDNTTIFLSWGLPVHHKDIFDYTVHVEHARLEMEKYQVSRSIHPPFLASIPGLSKVSKVPSFNLK